MSDQPQGPEGWQPPPRQLYQPPARPQHTTPAPPAAPAPGHGYPPAPPPGYDRLGTPGWSAPPPPRKQRHTGRNVLIGVAALVAVTIGGALAGGGGDPAPTAVTEAPAAPTADQPAKPKAPAAAPASKPKPKRWRTVVSVSGTSDKRTSLFTLHGGRARLRYTFTDTSGFSVLVGAVYLVEEGTVLQRDGGFPEVTVTESGSDSTELAPVDGRHYLEVKAANARWTVTIQEYR